ncbi:MAG: type II toxin-antitoxin system HicA family toxin [Desulfovibrionaceae bacterium]|nr:type II toxin-antitoxin system HicA family toxin [Desulfovibrionaceae bacterium]
MNSNQFKKWLAEQGATFTSGKGSHLKVELDGRRPVLPMHGSKEIGRRLELKIKRDLGLKQ